MSLAYRYAKAMRFFTQGYHEDLDVLLNKAIFTEDSDEMVLLRNIVGLPLIFTGVVYRVPHLDIYICTSVCLQEFFSLCEHHLVPFYGRAHIAYLPRGKVVGLSKLVRVAEHFGRRLQVCSLTQSALCCVNRFWLHMCAMFLIRETFNQT